MRTLILVLCLPLLVAACADPGPWASDASVAAARHRDDGPAMLTLFTMINNENGQGAHSALMVNASQRVIFNPAGTFRHPYAHRNAPMCTTASPINMVDFFIDYHARETYRVIRHDIEVSPENAERILAADRDPRRGARNALCTTSINNILRDIPGFETAAAFALSQAHDARLRPAARRHHPALLR